MSRLRAPFLSIIPSVAPLAAPETAESTKRFSARLWRSYQTSLHPARSAISIVNGTLAVAVHGRKNCERFC